MNDVIKTSMPDTVYQAGKEENQATTGGPLLD